MRDEREPLLTITYIPIVYAQSASQCHIFCYSSSKSLNLTNVCAVLTILTITGQQIFLAVSQRFNMTHLNQQKMCHKSMNVNVIKKDWWEIWTRCWSVHDTECYQTFGKYGGLMVSAQHSRLSYPSSSPDHWVTALCSWARNCKSYPGRCRNTPHHYGNGK